MSAQDSDPYATDGEQDQDQVRSQEELRIRAVYKALIDANPAIVPATLQELYNARDPNCSLFVGALMAFFEKTPPGSPPIIMLFEGGVQDTLVDMVCDLCSFPLDDPDYEIPRRHKVRKQLTL